jgi:hypothetical protein
MRGWVGRGGGVILKVGYMDGAIRSGHRAAREVMAALTNYKFEPYVPPQSDLIERVENRFQPLAKALPSVRTAQKIAAALVLGGLALILKFLRLF